MTRAARGIAIFCDAISIYAANNDARRDVHLNDARSEQDTTAGEDLTEVSIASSLRGARAMATYRDPARVFAPLEIIERLLEIRFDAGHAPSLYIQSAEDIALYLDAYGFDVYQFEDTDTVFEFGKYRATIAPGGDRAHESLVAH